MCQMSAKHSQSFVFTGVYPPFHGGNRGSNPLGDARLSMIYAALSVGHAVNWFASWATSVRRYENPNDGAGGLLVVNKPTGQWEKPK